MADKCLIILENLLRGSSVRGNLKDEIPEIPEETLMAFSGKYLTLFEQVTGRNFEKPSGDQSIRDRVRDSLARAFPCYFK